MKVVEEKTPRMQMMKFWESFSDLVFHENDINHKIYKSGPHTTLFSGGRILKLDRPIVTHPLWK
jgi:hypothetical protein